MKVGDLGKSDDPATWTSFQYALVNYRRLRCDGIGLCRTEDLIFVDLDGVLDPAGNIREFRWAKPILETVKGRAYAERSVSGTGIHAVCRGKLPPGRREFDEPNLEHTGFGLYDTARYFTFTGCVVPQSGPICDLTEELARLHKDLFPVAARHNGSSPRPISISDTELLDRARRATNGAAFARLFAGEWEGQYASQSEADLGLCCHLAFWTGRDASRMDALFRQSGLYRDKWGRTDREGRNDYKERTIAAAIAQTQEVYEPHRNGHHAAAAPDGGDGHSHKGGEGGGGAAANTESAAEATERETSVDVLADAILAEHHFARDPGGRLYVYADGVYKPTGELVIRQRVKGIMTEWGIAEKWSTRRTFEVVEYIRVDCPELWPTPPPDVINVQNGLLDVHTLELKPHAPEFLSAIQLPVAYDPEARCTAIDQFISEVFPEDAEAIAWEIPAWLITPVNDIQKAVLLLGEGSNGKSTYLSLCTAFIGRHNSAALSLHKLEQDRFAVARLVAKLANICPDLPTAHLSSTSMFKALTGGDVLSAEHKFRDSFEYTPYVKLVFSANKPPQSDDATHGFFRRWQVVPFMRCFEEGAKETKSRSELDARLTEPTELSGLLNKALSALQKIRQSGFSEAPSMRQAWDDFRTATDPLRVWLDQETITLPTAMVSKWELMTAFNKHLVDAGKPPMVKTAFGLAIKRARPEIAEAQRNWRGREKTWVYTGIGFKAEEPNA